MTENELMTVRDEFLNIHNKVQEIIQLEREGKWYAADTKLAGVKQRSLNMYGKIDNIIQIDFSKNNNVEDKNENIGN
jgi:hypothetical protein